MLHKTVTIDATATDLGHFEAVAATWSVDRVNEQIVKGAFAQTIESWRQSGKRVPVHWDHQGEAANVIGSVDPATMAETNEGLYVEGQLDIEDSEVAREAWRSMKNNTVSLSFGYMVLADHKRTDGVRELRQLDLFEVSLTPSPANADTRVLSMKSAAAESTEYEDLLPSKAEILAAVKEIEAEQQQRQEIERVAKKARPIKIVTFQC
jgi:HK97 family phage prohead protease